MLSSHVSNTLIILRNVNLYAYPDKDSSPPNKNAQLTLGDLHGNVILLLFFLTQHHIIEISEIDYERLVDLFLIEERTKDNYVEFASIIDKIKIETAVKVLLAGDVFADRVGDDYLTLLLIAKVKKENLFLKIDISNHDLEFIIAYEKLLGEGKEEKFTRTLLGEMHCHSMLEMQSQIDKGNIDLQDVLDLINQYYKPCLQVLSYVLNTYGDRDEFTLCSHAPIGLPLIKALANKLGVEYADKNIFERAETIDKINSIFQHKFVLTNRVHTLFDLSIIEALNDPFGRNYNADDYPFELLTWNRYYGDLVRPRIENDCYFIYVHGHDIEETTSDIFSLDGRLGKGLLEYRGRYTVLHTVGQRFSVEIDPKQENKEDEEKNDKKKIPSQTGLTFTFYNGISRETVPLPKIITTHLAHNLKVREDEESEDEESEDKILHKQSQG